ncbi:UbiA family prenyltransferase [Streptomyces sp. NPDC006552]|uniref:UbiA family prenyltransferase n=1 Tax=Streptomyces sp. NPDC006552 TaxID=3157179 RepID=UPI0033A04F93
MTAAAPADAAPGHPSAGTRQPTATRATLRAWAELLRLPALFTVPGDALAGAAAVGARPGRGTVLALSSSLCLYEAGMALNDWADRAEDAVDRPHRPIPSGRIRPAAALAAAGAFTAAGLGLACAAGRTAGTIGAVLAATVWGYDLGLKRTPAGPLAMGAARGLDLLMGAAASQGDAGRFGGGGLAGGPWHEGDGSAGTRSQGAGAPRPGAGLPGAAGHSPGSPTALRPGGGALRATSRGAGALREGAGLLRARVQEAAASRGGSGIPRAGVLDPVIPCGSSGLLRAGVQDAAAFPRGSRLRARGGAPASLRVAAPSALVLAAHTAAVTTVSRNETTGGAPAAPAAALATTVVLITHLLRLPVGRGAAAPLGLPGPTAYAATTLVPLLHAVLNPSPPLTQRAVGAGIRAMIPLQAALAARAGAPRTALATAALAPLARRFAKKVSVT